MKLLLSYYIKQNNAKNKNSNAVSNKTYPIYQWDILILISRTFDALLFESFTIGDISNFTKRYFTQTT